MCFFQMCDQEPDYEELKGSHPLCRPPEPGEELEEEPRPDQIHQEFQRLFMPPSQNPSSDVLPPVLRRISDRRHRMEAQGESWEGRLQQGRGVGGDGEGENKRTFPRLYPSIRLAMREIQHVQQVRYCDKTFLQGSIS